MSKTQTAPKEYLAEVRGQYEVLPYPMRDPKKERNQFFTCDHISLDSLNHEAWGGMRDLRQKGMRVLIAGQGTGDATIFFAEQLRGTEAEIVSIDLSTTSINICKERLAARGLTNVTVHHMSIMDVPTANLGQFDVIDCSGVLHHLADPAEGLKALASVLKDDGIIALMVYALYGRFAVYVTQVLMGYLTSPDMSPAMKIELARAFTESLPKTHPMHHCSGWYSDIKEETGSGIYDLLLHSTDRAYSVPQLYDWAMQAGLVMGNFCNEWEGNIAYTPEYYTRSPLLRALVADKPEPERQAIAELMCGSILKHVFYVTKQPKVPAQFSDDMVIVQGFQQKLFTGFYELIANDIDKAEIGSEYEQVSKLLRCPSLLIKKRKHTAALLRALEKGGTIGEITARVVKKTKAPQAEVRADFEALYHELNTRRRVYLRHKDVPPYIHFVQIHERLKQFPPLTLSA